MCDPFALLLYKLHNGSYAERIESIKGFYELAVIEKPLRPKIFSVLYLYLRKILNPPPPPPPPPPPLPKPTEEVQSLLDVLFKPDSNNGFIFDDIDINVDLQGMHLQGADLHEANLQNVDLQGAHLHFADLHEANLQNVDLQGAHLHFANLHEANLQNAILTKAILQEATLDMAKMQNAILTKAKLRKANMFWARITQKTHKTMPDGWEKIVIQYKGKTGALLVDENDKKIDDL